MKDQLQDKLVEILGGIQSAVKSGSDFVITQLPDVAQQYVTYGRVWTLVILIPAAIAFITSLYVFIQYGIRDKAKDIHASEGAFMFGAIGAVFSGGITLFMARQAALVWFAPKVWLLLEISKLIR